MVSRFLHGYGEAKTWGLQLASDLRLYKEGCLAWEDVDRGVLLSGPPGCGKTFYATALAAECEVPLVLSSYADWEAKTGSGNLIAKAIKQVFADARKRAPCILFIDEIDSIGSRGTRERNSGWFDTVINTVLAELDGSEPRDGVVVIAATNFPDAVDPALLRPGRLDRHVAIPTPTIADIAGIIMLHAPTARENIDAAARACRGMTPARITQVCREARRVARREKRAVTGADIVAEVAAGRPKRDADEDRPIALHESAHALVGVLLGLTVKAVDADEGRTSVAGFGTFATREVLEKHIALMLAGRIANTLHGAGPPVGASQDLEDATALAITAVARYGMGGRLAVMPPEAAVVDDTIRREAEGMLARADAVARELLGENKPALMRLTDALLKARYLDADEVRAIVHGPGPVLG